MFCNHIPGVAAARRTSIHILLVVLSVVVSCATGAKAANSVLQLTANNPDGKNTGAARLGVPLTFSTVDTDPAHQHIDWTLTGAGTLIPNGGGFKPDATYTPPAVMPSSATVTVIAYLDSLPSVTTSYTFTLINPVPTVTSASPAVLLTGGTQMVTLAGSGFVPGTSVTWNGQPFPIAYINYNQARVEIPVPGNAAGTLTSQVHNPGPGGGGGSTFTESIPPNSVTVTATDADGTNTGTAELGSSVNMTGMESGSINTKIIWSVTGAGSISTSGVYTPPTSVMPSNRAVTIQGALAANPAITDSYSLTLVNPVPEIIAASPYTIADGATTAVTLTGSGFVPSTVITVNGVAVPSTFVSPTSIVAQITAPPTAIGNLNVQASTSAFNGGFSRFLSVATFAPISPTAAARLLDQTTFGPTTSLIQHVQQEGVAAWLMEQFHTPQTVMPEVPLVVPAYSGEGNDRFYFESEWWKTAVTGDDQLRQRVALALSELFVTSEQPVDGWAMDSYVNTLGRDAFTNWYTIMNDVTLSPAMGVYLNMVNSAKQTGTLIANENFARENMQLFNLGLDLLNQDGSLIRDGSGNPIPTYTEAQVQAFARVYTGWTFANADGSTPSSLSGVEVDNYPMVAVENQHDEGSKTLLNGTTLRAGQTAEQDLAAAETNIFQHPNLPPFVCKQLIQHLVKSNPSPAYVARVADVFVNNGSNVRGDMKSVLTAIFSDAEARHGDTAAQPSDGHLREPILWMTGVMRGLGYVNVDPNDYWDSLYGYAEALDEHPFDSLAVFNFFPPSYVIPGTTLRAPEFGIENTATSIYRLTLADQFLANNITAFNVDFSPSSPLGSILASQGPAGLVTALNNLFLYGTMDSATAAAITSEVETAANNPERQVRLAAYLVITSTPYKIVH